MKHIAKWDFKHIIRDNKNRVIFILLLIFFGTFSLLYKQQDVTYPQYEINELHLNENAIYRIIPPNHFDTELGQEVQQRLGSNSIALGNNRYILSKRQGNAIEKLSILPDYIENGLTIVENNLWLYEATEFESYDILVEDYLPEIEAVEQDKRFYEALRDSGLDIEWNPFSASQVTKTQVDLIAGVALFIFIAILAADQFTKNNENNFRIAFNIPIKWKTRWRIRSVYLWGFFWAVYLIGLFISYGLSRLIESAGSLLYPTAIYQNGSIEYIPLWQYIIIVISLSMVLSYLLLLIATGLSWIFRNIYLTMLIVVALFYLPNIWSSIPVFSSFQPTLYLNISGFLDGTTAQMTGLTDIVWWKAFIAYAIIIVLIEWLFTKVYSRIPTANQGLQRRVLA